MRMIKRQAAAGVLMVLAVFIFLNTNAMNGKTAGIRVAPPLKGEIGTQYYYNEENNPFYPHVAPFQKVKGGYVTGNCTWYAWGRACEIAGGKLPYVFTGDAGTWWEQNKKDGWYDYGHRPKRGAIICYKTHVGVVEQEKPLTISESGWEVSTKKDYVIFHCGVPWRSNEKTLGYIYVEISTCLASRYNKKSKIVFKKFQKRVGCNRNVISRNYNKAITRKQYKE